MTFKFFDNMENILGDRRTVQGQSTISSTFAKKNSKLQLSTITQPIRNMSNSTFMAQSDVSVSSPSTSNTTSSTRSSHSAKKQIFENPLKSEDKPSKNKQTLASATLEKVVSSDTETTVSLTSINNTQKNKRPLHGTGSRIAKSKVELEKQWLQHLKNAADRDKMKKEKQEAYEKRKVEEMQMKKKLIALKERQLDVKQNAAKRKLEEAAEWHRDKLNIEKQKCRLLKELLETRTSSHNKRFKTDTDSSYED